MALVFYLCVAQDEQSGHMETWQVIASVSCSFADLREFKNCVFEHIASAMIMIGSDNVSLQKEDSI